MRQRMPGGMPRCWSGIVFSKKYPTTIYKEVYASVVTRVTTSRIGSSKNLRLSLGDCLLAHELFSGVCVPCVCSDTDSCKHLRTRRRSQRHKHAGGREPNKNNPGSSGGIHYSTITTRSELPAPSCRRLGVNQRRSERRYKLAVVILLMTMGRSGAFLHQFFAPGKIVFRVRSSPGFVASNRICFAAFVSPCLRTQR